MLDYHQCDIWLCESAQHTKDGMKHKRPVAIVSNDEYNQTNDEFICLHLTTCLNHEHAVRLFPQDFEKSLLVDESAVRYDGIMRYSKTILSKKLGVLKREKLRGILEKTKEIIRVR